MEYGESPKYLVLGAPWNTIFVGSSSVTARVTNEESVSTPAGVFDSFVLSYKLAEQTSKIWVVRDMPLPVKAEVYDAEDKLLYQYELANVSEVTPAAIGNSL
jgi:outer membrane lipoprotein-sorting protein